MSLPSGGPWPPPPHDIALGQQAVWSAWLTGDPERLSEIYGAIGGGSTAKREGGVLPTLARFFWGRPSVTGTQRKHRLHIPLAADIATASADLLFSEPPQFTVAEGGNEAANKRVDALLNTGSFHATLLEAGEIAAALGGGWLRLVWDKDVADHVMIQTVDADAGIGEWRFGRLQAVTFFTEFTTDANKGEVYRHLERHEPGYILHGLYLGEPGKLGRPVPLVDHPDTAYLAELVDAEGAISTGVKGLTAAYVPNMRPHRKWRRLPQISEMGRSDYDGVEPLMDALDETYTSWMRDIRLAKARLLVPEFMLTNLGKGKGAAFDEDREIYAQLNIPPAEGASKQITAQQFEIRFEAHRETADQLIDHILESAGYSPSTFGRGKEGMSTATEIVSRERQSERTRDKKARYWDGALELLLSTWLQLDALVFGTGATGQPVVEWPPQAQADPLQLAQTATALRQGEAASTDTLVRLLHPDWDEEQIVAEVAAIASESGRAVPDLGPVAE